MQITLYQIAVWLILGFLAGSLAGLIVKGEKRGFGLQINLVLGLGGAVVGGLIFRLFNLFPSLDKIAISLRDIVAALAGSFLILAAFWIWRRRYSKAQ
ncbi:MAG: GlsB/YeaQ/YmgE family stress response membrane protein [Rhodomicrobium sp.]